MGEVVTREELTAEVYRLREQRDALLDEALAEGWGLSDDEDAAYRDLTRQLFLLGERLERSRAAFRESIRSSS